MGDSSQWVRSHIQRGPSCLICGYKGRCLIHVNGDAVVCFNVKEGCAKRGDGSDIKVMNNMGWVHRLSPDQIAAEKKTNRVKGPKVKENASLIDWELLQRKLTTQVNPKRLALFADGLGLSMEGCRAFGVGYDIDTACWTFPMYSGVRARNGWGICGIQMRPYTGRKFAVRGSDVGLFLPVDYEVPMGGDTPLILVVPEGATDSIMARDCGFRAIGRPSCWTGYAECRRILSQGQKQHVVIFSDRDETKWMKDREGKITDPFWPGWEGAIALARALHEFAASVRIMQPPKGIKDLRCWIMADRANVFTLQGGMVSTPELGMEDIFELHEVVERMRRVVKRPEIKQ